MPTPRIFDRASFRAALYAAQARTSELQRTHPKWSLLDTIAKQLAAVAERTFAQPPRADARLRHVDIDLGPLAARSLAEQHHDFASLLKDIDYAQRRYDALPGGCDGWPSATRRGILQVVYGSDAFRKHVLASGTRALVGRGENSDFVLRDNTLAPRHIEVCWDGIVAQLRTLAAASQMQVRGRPVWRAELRHGEVVQLGDSTLRFLVEDYSNAAIPPSAAADEGHDNISAAMATLKNAWQNNHLYAVVDAARDRRVLLLLEEAIDDHASLYQGARGRALDCEAPYMVHFSAQSMLLPRWLMASWQRAWGVFLCSAEAPPMVRRTLRRLLMVEAEERRDKLYFRYYDPRVLAQFWPLTTPRQRSEMLRDIDAFFFEDGSGGLLNTKIDAPSP